MLARKTCGALGAVATPDLLGFLGLKKGAAGIHKVPAEIELVAAAPLALADGGGADGIPWTLSTFDIDRHGERIDPEGWDFARYMENPVIEWAHRYDIPAIGRMEGLAIDARGLHGIVRFNGKEYDEFGWSIGERVKAGAIRAGSVGFRVMEIEIPAKDGGEDAALIFRKQELLEFSICNVPANPFALAKGARALPGKVFPAFWGNIINDNRGETT